MKNTWIRLALLVLSFIAVVLTMMKLHEAGLSSTTKNVLQMPDPQAVERRAKVLDEKPESRP